MHVARRKLTSIVIIMGPTIDISRDNEGQSPRKSVANLFYYTVFACTSHSVQVFISVDNYSLYLLSSHITGTWYDIEPSRNTAHRHM